VSAGPEVGVSDQPGTGAGMGAGSLSVEADSRRWLALTVLAAATLMVVLDTSIVSLALPRAQGELGLSEATRGWVVTAYTAAFGGLLLLGGRMGDLIGASASS